MWYLNLISRISQSICHVCSINVHQKFKGSHYIISSIRRTIWYNKKSENRSPIFLPCNYYVIILLARILFSDGCCVPEYGILRLVRREVFKLGKHIYDFVSNDVRQIFLLENGGCKCKTYTSFLFPIHNNLLLHCAKFLFSNNNAYL